MNLKRQITHALMAALPAVDRQRLVNDFVDWLYADLPPDDRQHKAERLAPRLLEWMAESSVGLWLVLFQHLMRLPPVRALERALGCPPTGARPRQMEVGPATLEVGTEPPGQ